MRNELRILSETDQTNNYDRTLTYIVSNVNINVIFKPFLRLPFYLFPNQLFPSQLALYFARS